MVYLRRQLLRYGRPFLFLCLVLFSLDIIFMAVHKPSYMKRFLDRFKRKDGEFTDRSSIFKSAVDLRVIVLTYNRPESLARCLSSLNDAVYDSDKIVVDVWIDRSEKEEDGGVDAGTYAVAKKFVFAHGDVDVHNHSSHVGVRGQWLSTWNVEKSGKEIAIFLEDDVTVSKYFYRWLKAVHGKYDSYPNINGYSTQGVSMRHSGNPGRLDPPADQVCFLYPVLGTWGFSPSRENWLKFVHWYAHASTERNFQPTVPGILPSAWYASFVKRGKTHRMWSMWHIYFAWKNTEYTLYPNLPGRKGLTISWKDKGLNYRAKGGNSGAKKARRPDPILETWDESFVKLPDKPVVLDYTGAVIVK